MDLIFNMRFVLLLSCLVLLASGCSPLTTKQASTPPMQPQSNLPLPEHWKITAKLGMKVPQKSGSVSLTWQQRDASYRIQIQAPLGQGSALIYGNAERIVIQQPGKPILSSHDASALIEETLGWRFPIHDLKYWIRGIPNPDSNTFIEQQSQTGILETLEQSNWMIRYSRHQLIDQWQFPGKIIARQGDTRLTMIIRKWELL